MNPIDLPVLPSQQRLLFLERLHPGSGTYHIHAAWLLSGPVDASVLQSAVQHLVERHDALRAVFPVVEGEHRQRILPHVALELSVVDCSIAEHPEAAVQRVVDRERAAPFDLAQGPLVRAGLVRLGEQRHVFHLTLNHLISDGWSKALLARELGAIVEARSNGQDAGLPPAPSYVEHVRAQSRPQAVQRREAALAYWRDVMADPPAPLDIPVERPEAHTSPQGLQAGTFEWDIDEALHQTLRRLCEAQGASTFCGLAAAFGVLLNRMTGQADVCIAYPCASRSEAHTHGLVGFLVETLVLRMRPAPGRRFRDLLQEVRQALAEGRAHEALPFERLVDALRAGTPDERAQPFQVMLNPNRHDEPPLHLPGVQARHLPRTAPGAVFELSVVFGRRETGAYARFEYDTSRFSEASIRQIAQWYGHVLQAVVASPELRVRDANLVPEAERRQNLQRWNDTQQPWPAGRLLHQWFEAQADAQPDRIALAFGEQQLSYGELEARSNRLAHRLRAEGVQARGLVGVCLERSPRLVVALLAILKAGAAYVPLDLRAPPERLGRLVGEAGLSAVVVEPGTAALLPHGDHRTVMLETDEGDAAAAGRLPPGDASRELAYCLFTSGTTGVPKAVMLEHANASAFLHWALGSFGDVLRGRVLFGTAVTFDLSVFELFGTLAAGGTVVLVRDALVLADPQAPCQLDVVNTVPSVARALMEAHALPEGLPVLNLAGEELPRSLLEALRARLPGTRIVNLYGPTETTTYSTCAETTGECSRPVSIGHAIANTRVYLLDERHRPVPLGLPGEVYIAGEGVARGYLRRPDLTAERFLPDPHGPPGSRMYRTGDLARQRADGALAYLGRGDQQVKLRGFRVELGEVEHALSCCAGVRQAAVLALDAGGAGPRLAAFVVPGSPVPDPSQLQARLAERLPDYMVPTEWCFLPALPLNANGKVDRAALQRQARGGAAPSTPAAPAVQQVAQQQQQQQATLAQLTSLLQELLPGTPVGPLDPLLSVGLNSLLLLRLEARLRERMGVALGVRALYRARTLQGIAQAIDAAAAAVAA